MDFKIIMSKKMLLFQILLFCFNAHAKLCVDFSTKSLLSLLSALQFNVNKSFEGIENDAGSGADSVIDVLSEVVWESTESILENIDENTEVLKGEVEHRTESVLDELQVLRGVVDGLDQLVIDRNLSKSGDFITTGTTISSGGYYSLRGTTTGCITVAANDVILDLGGFTLYCETGPVITVNSSLKNIEIKNGKVKSNGSQDGIRVLNSCSLIMIENVKAYSCNVGINFNGVAPGTVVKNSKIKNCDFYSCLLGSFLEYSREVIFQCCNTFNCLFGGFVQNDSSFNVYEKCNALHTSGNVSVVGFSSSGGNGNLFSECVAIKTEGINNAYGFQLLGESCSKIVNCVANMTKTTVGTSASGILLGAGTTACFLEGNETLNSNGDGISVAQAVAEDNLLLKNVSYNNTTQNYFPRQQTYPPSSSCVTNFQINPPFIRNIYDYDHDGTCFASTDPQRYDNLDVLAC